MMFSRRPGERFNRGRVRPNNRDEDFLITDTKTASFSASAGYRYIIGTLAAVCTVTLPAVHTAGDRIEILGPPNAATYSVTITSADSDTIAGDAAFYILANYGALTLISDGTNWRVL